MESRKYPRIRTSFLASLISGNGTRQNRRIENISESGFFISGPSTQKQGERCQLTIRIADDPGELTLDALVVHSDADGLGFAFESLDARQLQQLTQCINPRWDGRDLLEGVIMHGILENTDNLADSLRLTSLLSSNYQRTSKAFSQTG